MNIDEAIGAIMQEKDRTILRNLSGTPSLEIMRIYNLSFEEAEKLKVHARIRDSECFNEQITEWDRRYLEEQKNETEPTTFGYILWYMGFILFVICCFGGVIGIMIGISILLFTHFKVEEYFSKKKYPNDIIPIKTSPLVIDLEKYYWKILQKRHK